MPVGEALWGRVVDALGQPFDGKGWIDMTNCFSIEAIAPGIIAREPISQPLQTGLIKLDALVPICRGRRELILGDRQTGKTAIALDTTMYQ